MEKLKYFHPVPEAWLAFEKESISSYKKSLDEARKLMKSNRSAEAEKLLNDAFQKIWKKVVTDFIAFRDLMSLKYVAYDKFNF